jgi:two-component system, chemotaxis family, chemotaxis protein CheY
MTRILTVDDSPPIRDLVSMVLSQAGFQVTQAQDGVEALALAKKSSHDLVLADVHMPNMDGIALIRALRAESAYRHTPILMLTVDSDPERRREGKNAGATGWIIKPLVPEKLLAAIRRALS